jgi:hypothetical protein
MTAKKEGRKRRTKKKARKRKQIHNKQKIDTEGVRPLGTIWFRDPALWESGSSGP